MVDTSTGEILEDCNIVGKVSAFLKHLEKKHSDKKDRMVVIHEAGALGYTPSRKMSKLGYTNRMIAPSSIPRSGKMQKTDRRDAINNLQHFVAGSLRFVTIPDEHDEHVREWLRYRQELNHRVTQQKQRILGFVKRQGLEYTKTKTNWTKTHYSWLESVVMPAVTRDLLNVELEDLNRFEEQLSQVDKVLDIYFASNPRYAFYLWVYQVFAGIGRIGAMTLVLEGGDLTRFAHPNAIMNFFGLVPQKCASGTSDPSMHITKAGNTYVRLALVTAARVYRDFRLLRKEKYLKTLPEPLGNFIRRMQQRLSHRYRNLRSNGKHSNKAKCAIARELCGFLWELNTQIIPQLPEMHYELKKAA
jgi:transposase